MTLRAILDDGQLHYPGLEVLAGRLPLEEANRRYAGRPAVCPDCQSLLSMADPTTVGDLAAAVGDRRLRVTFRSGCVDGGQLVRAPHWAHLPRTRPDAGARPCARESDQRHAVVVAAIADHYRRERGAEVSVRIEAQYRQGETVYRPDVSIRGAAGEHLTCIEYQRSREAIASFRQRHQLRAVDWPEVIWFFDRAIYSDRSTRAARTWLYERGLQFYECRIDDRSGALLVEAGTPADAGELVRERTIRPRPCIDVAKAPSLDPTAADWRTTALEGATFTEALTQARDALRADYARLEAERQAEAAAIAEAGEQRLLWQQLQEVARTVAILDDRGRSPATADWPSAALAQELQRLRALEPEAEALYLEHDRQRQARQAELARRYAQQVQRVEERDRQRQQELVSGRRERAIAALQLRDAIGLAEAAQLTTEELERRAALLAGWGSVPDVAVASMAERVRTAGTLPPVEAVDALLLLRREANGSAGWVIQRLACSPAGQDLRSWQILGRRLNYRSGWAEHRHREALARSG